MREGPRIERRDEQPYVSIRTRATLNEWPRVNALVLDVLHWMEERGLGSAGAPFFRYWTIGDDRDPYDLEVGWPVDEVPEPEGAVRVGTIPGASYVRLVHHGHPDRLDRAHDALREWADRKGVELKVETEGGREVWAGVFECYLTDPADEPDPAEWRTELLYQIA
jgi:effector-binding domain-containing protein